MAKIISTSDFVSLDSFCLQVQQAVEEFKDAWMEANKANPQDYPYMFPQGNSEAWWEMLEVFMETGEV